MFHKPNHRLSLFVVTSCLCIAFFSVACNADETVSLVDNATSQYAVVIPQSPNPAEEKAAEEFVGHIFMATGCRLPVVKEDDLSRECFISIGRTKSSRAVLADSQLQELGSDGYLIKTQGQKLFILGQNPRGSLYGVYHYLEDLGFRWLADDCTIVPKVQTLKLGQWNLRYTPVFTYRDQIWNDYPQNAWKARQRLNGEFQWLPKEWGGSAKVLLRCHSIRDLLPATVAVKRPEWLALKQDGTRDKPVPHNVQLCTTHPDVRKYILGGVLNRLARQPDADYIWVSQDDGPGGCYCQRCRKEREPFGDVLSANTIALATYVARNIHDKYPNVKVKTLAYGHTEEPPTGMKVDDKVVVVFTGPHTSYHPVHTCPRNANYYRKLKAWSKIADVQTYFYGANYYFYLAPNPNWMAMCDDYKRAAELGIRRVYRQGTGIGIGSEFVQLRRYLTARMAWDPSRDPEKELDEFLEGYYGPSASFIREYIDFYVKKMENWHGDPAKSGWKALVDYKTLEFAENCFEQALAAVRDKPAYLKRVREAYLPILYARIMIDIPSKPVLKNGQYLLLPGKLGNKIKRAASMFTEIMNEANYTHWDENTKYDKTNNPVSALGRSHEYVTLSNPTDEVIIVPTLGGRIVSWRTGGVGNLFREPDTARVRYPYIGGYEEYSRFHVWSEGMALDFRLQSCDGRKVVMNANLADGLKVQRTITLDADSSTVTVVSRYYNETSEVLKVKLRNHPEFSLSHFNDAKLQYPGPDGVWRTLTLHSVHSRQDEKSLLGKDLARGVWVIANQDKNTGLINWFGSKDLDRGYLFWGEALDVLTVELWQREISLKPGESQSLENKYQFSRDLKQSLKTILNSREGGND